MATSDYWMKTLRSVYPFALEDRTKFMNKDSTIGRFFSHHFQDMVTGLLKPEHGLK